MKHLTITAAAASMLFVAPAFADDAHHPEKAPKTAAAATKPAEAKPMQTDQSMAAMQDRMQKMSELMDKAQKTTDPKERQKLLEAHMQAMSEGMKVMSGMGDGMMMGMMGGRDGAKDKGQHDNCSMMGGHEMMGKRMDMMQMMMGQMMEHQKTAEAMAR